MKRILLILMLFPFLFINISATIRNNDTAYIVMEANTNRVLEQKNMEKQMLIASTAKILTAITVIENYNLNEEVIISEKDVNEKHL